MSFWLLEINAPRCRDCGSVAKFTVMNSRNASQGDYCAPHAKRRAAALNKEHSVVAKGPD